MIDIKKDQETVLSGFHWGKQNVLKLWKIFPKENMHLLAEYCRTKKHTFKETAARTGNKISKISKVLNEILLVAENFFDEPNVGVLIEAYCSFPKEFGLLFSHKFIKCWLDLCEAETVKDPDEQSCICEQLACMFTEKLYDAMEHPGKGWGNGMDEYKFLGSTCWFRYDNDVDSFETSAYL